MNNANIGGADALKNEISPEFVSNPRYRSRICGLCANGKGDGKRVAARLTL
jgi:hypothetical protein